eukprot:CAMPEP_0202963284 /NCGR_PEP_ID=MMETSP1396-20130829/7266_1 /ASSEMBLY_ACC=CAM_ASM_000872 /TAXON_ID= /ORGANISM="Pseudokeronopsis sp., Strain Brazil" /LENGTH=73 /DNA_ID=CAMNT_0049684355 /DNA_START=682 /DNA_END=903 /DNA_ORIENTATION=-
MSKVSQKMLIEKELDENLKDDTISQRIYVIDKAWFNKWIAYVSSEEADPPGPITNNSVVKVEQVNGRIVVKKR